RHLKALRSVNPVKSARQLPRVKRACGRLRIAARLFHPARPERGKEAGAGRLGPLRLLVSKLTKAHRLSSRQAAFLMWSCDTPSSNRVPGMFYTKENVLAGGFMSYGASVPDLLRRGAWYVHRILQGTKPSDLPIEQTTKFDDP